MTDGIKRFVETQGGEYFALREPTEQEVDYAMSHPDEVLYVGATRVRETGDHGNDWEEFFAAASAADLALVGVLGDDLDAGEIEAVGDAMTKLMEARHFVGKVFDKRHSR